jgi:hypothetical protein
MNRSSIRIHEAVLLLLLTVGACHCKRHTLVPSQNTVDPAKHEPYQSRPPKSSALQVAGREASPDPPSGGAAGTGPTTP